MPKRDVHAFAGLLAGFVTGLAGGTRRIAPSTDAHLGLLAQRMGGGVMPDLIEPMVSPNHRSVAHSLVAAGGLVAVAKATYHAKCFERAAACEQHAALLAAGSPERGKELSLGCSMARHRGKCAWICRRLRVAPFA
jgi:hypothetical protein